MPSNKYLGRRREKARFFTRENWFFPTIFVVADGGMIVAYQKRILLPAMDPRDTGAG
jgi:hypothetical protein